MPLNIEHSLEYVSTPSASSEDYVLPPDLPRETTDRGGGGALPYWKVRLNVRLLRPPFSAHSLPKAPLK